MSVLKESFLSNECLIHEFKYLNSHVYKCDFKVEAYNDHLFEELNIHFPNTLIKAVNKRRAEFLAGRYCADKCLQKVNIQNFEIKADSNRCPLWPEGVKGSITHSNSVAIAVVSTQPSILGVGIDIEPVIPANTLEAVSGQIIYEDEVSLLEQKVVSRETIFSLIFSIKESFFKAAYPSTGYYFGFEAVRVNEIDFTLNQFTLTLCQDLNATLVKGTSYLGNFKIVNGEVLSILVIEAV